MLAERSDHGCRILLLALVVACAFGCKETVSGRYIDTEGIALVADVTAASDDESELDIDFVVGGDESNTYVDLARDRVRAAADGMDKTLKPRSKGEYRTTFATGEGGTEFTIELDRDDDDKTDAPDTSGILPDPFSVSVEPSGDISRQEALTVTWEPAGGADDVRIDLDGDCVFFTFESGEDDDGEFTIAANDLILGGDPEADDEGPCDVEVTVTRTNRGTTDDTFDSESKFRLHQVRSVEYRSVP